MPRFAPQNLSRTYDATRLRSWRYRRGIARPGERVTRSIPAILPTILSHRLTYLTPPPDEPLTLEQLPRGYHSDTDWQRAIIQLWEAGYTLRQLVVLTGRNLPTLARLIGSRTRPAPLQERIRGTL